MIAQAVFILFLAFDLASIRQEPNLERRSELAMENATGAMDGARDASVTGDEAKLKAQLDEVLESVDLAYKSLVDSGKNARKSPRFFKKAELRTRELMRRLDGLAHSVDVEELVHVERTRDRVSAVHDDLIRDIMQKK